MMYLICKSSVLQFSWHHLSTLNNSQLWNRNLYPDLKWGIYLEQIVKEVEGIECHGNMAGFSILHCNSDVRKGTVLYVSTAWDGGKRPPEPLFLLMVFRQFQVNFSLFLFFKKVSPHLLFSFGRCREASWPVQVLNSADTRLTSGLSVLASVLFHPLAKWLGLLLLEVWTLCVVRNNPLCPI